MARQHLYGFALHGLCTGNRIGLHFIEIQGVSVKTKRRVVGKNIVSKMSALNFSIVFFRRLTSTFR